MRTLVLNGDNGHPASLTCDGLTGLADGGYEFEWVEDPGEWSAERMDDHPLIVFSKANERAQGNSERWATEETGKAFVDYVRNGRSVLFLHSGTAFYNDSPSLCNLMGGIFAGHPAPCLVTVEPRTGHPMVAGSDAFHAPRRALPHDDVSIPTSTSSSRPYPSTEPSRPAGSGPRAGAASAS